MLNKEKKDFLQDIVDLDDPLKPSKEPRKSKHFRRRMWAFVISLALIVAAIIFISSVFSNKDPGRRKIDLRPGSISKAYNSQFVFHYDLGANGNSAGREYRKLQNLYTQSLSDAKSLYSLRKVNSSPNSEIKVTKELYSALKALSDAGDRRIFLAPVYEQYSKVFGASSDEAAALNDPYLNESAMEYVNKLVEFISSPEHIDIRFGDENRLILDVSEEYMSFAKDNRISEYVDFFWMENALIIDYVADAMIKNDYTLGKISSYDGFSRDLNMNSGYVQVVIRRSPDRNININRYHVYADGQTRHPYIDASSGLCCELLEDLAIHQNGNTCKCLDTLLGLLEQL